MVILYHKCYKDDLQIPSTLRPKLVGMDAAVKGAMVKSSQTMALNPPPPHTNTLKVTPSPPITPKSKVLRRTRSIDSISSPKALDSTQYELPRPPISALVFGTAFPNANVGASSGLSLPNGHARGVSFDAANTSSRGQPRPAPLIDVNLSKAGKDKATAKHLSPANFYSILASKSSTSLEVESVKKLRLLLRNESARFVSSDSHHYKHQ
jgi:hypothetical protein